MDLLTTYDLPPHRDPSSHTDTLPRHSRGPPRLPTNPMTPTTPMTPSSSHQHSPPTVDVARHRHVHYFVTYSRTERLYFINRRRRCSSKNRAPAAGFRTVLLPLLPPPPFRTVLPPPSPAAAYTPNDRRKTIEECSCVQASDDHSWRVNHLWTTGFWISRPESFRVSGTTNMLLRNIFVCLYCLTKHLHMVLDDYAPELHSTKSPKRFKNTH